MKKILQLIFLFFTFFTLKVFSQAEPPVINGTKILPYVCGQPINSIRGESCASSDGHDSGSLAKTLPVGTYAYTQSIHNVVAKWLSGSVYRFSIGTASGLDNINAGHLLNSNEVHTGGHSFAELQASALALGTTFNIGDHFFMNLYYLSSSTTPDISFDLQFLWEDLGLSSNVVTVNVETGYGINGASPFTAIQAAKIQAFYNLVNPIIKSVYGPPSRNHTITVVNDAYAVGKNTYYNGPNFISSSYAINADGDLDQPRLMIHELIHGYRDNVCLSTNNLWHYEPTLSGFEEGFAEGVAIVVMDIFIGMYPNFFVGDAHKLHWNQEGGMPFEWDYDFQNHQQVSTQDFWSSDVATGSHWLRYGLGATAMKKMYYEDPNIFKNFNVEYYSRMNADHTLVPSRAMIVDIFSVVKAQVERTPTIQWINSQRIFDCQKDIRKKIFMLSFTSLSWNSFQQDNRIIPVETHQNGLEWKWDSSDPIGANEITNTTNSSWSWTHQLNNLTGDISIARDWATTNIVTNRPIQAKNHWINEAPNGFPTYIGIPLLGPYQGANPYYVGSTFTRDHEQDNCTAVPGCGKRAWAMGNQPLYTTTSSATTIWPTLAAIGGSPLGQRSELNLTESGLFRFEIGFNDPQGPRIEDSYFRLLGNDFIDIHGVFGGIYSPSATQVDGRLFIEHSGFGAEAQINLTNNCFKSPRLWTSVPETDVNRQGGRPDRKYSVPGMIHTIYVNPDCSQKKIDFRTIGYGDGLEGTEMLLFNVSDMEDILFTESNDTSVCAGEDFTLAVTNNFPDIFHNDPRVTYSWKDPSSTVISSDTTYNFIGAATTDAGVYTLDITFFGCPIFQKTVNVIIGNPPVINFGLPDTISVCTNDDINFTVNALSGATYTWTNPAGTVFSSSQNPIILGSTFLDAGYYTISISGAGCGGAPLSGIDSVYVNVTSSMTINLPNQPTDSVCEGVNVTLTTDLIAGATYTWTGPSNFSSSLQSPVISSIGLNGSGIYRVIVTLPGCNGVIVSDTSFTTIVVFPNTVATVTVPYTTLNVCENGSVNLSCTPTIGSTVVWVGPGAIFTSTTQNPTISGATAVMSGIYTVTVSSLGCDGLTTTATATINVIVQPNPTVTAIVPFPIINLCEGTSLNLAVSTAASGTYLWSEPVSAFSSSSQNPTISSVTPSMSGTYQVIVSVIGCAGIAISDTAFTFVNVTPTPVVNLVTTSLVNVCPGDMINLNSNTIPNAVYSWSGPNSFSSITEDASLIAVGTINSGLYTVTAVVPGCVPNTFITGTNTTQVIVPSIVGINLEIAGSELICLNENSTLLSASNVTVSSYLWTAPDGSTSTNPTLNISSFSISNVGTYYLMANYGCVGLDLIDSITIQLQDDDICNPKPSYYMPNVFSPNGDGQNDILYVYGKAVSQMALIIYDRLGEVVFYSDKLTQGWDGTFKGILLNTAVFAYQLNISFTTGIEPVAVNGNITLIR